MLTFSSGTSGGRTCDGLSRRNFLKLGGLCVGGLTLADLLRLRAAGAIDERKSHKAVIMVWLEGGPSHIDMYDLKPDAPVEYRGEFPPIRTVVPGLEICDLMPMQAKIADKLAIIRSMTFEQPDHQPPEELMTGFHDGGRPSIGAVMSRLQADSGAPRALPPFVQLDATRTASTRMGFSAYLGRAHEPFLPGADLTALAVDPKVGLERLQDRRALLSAFDNLRRGVEDLHDSTDSVDAYTAQALEMIGSNEARDAFDISRERPELVARYGTGTQLLQAVRLVEAGVKVVSVSFIGDPKASRAACGFGGGTWDTHGNTGKCLGYLVPQLDQVVHALVTDLSERGLENDVAVVFWGEFGRTPRITPNNPRLPGRGHWPEAGFALMTGGGLRMGQVIGATDARGGRPITTPYTPQNVLATLYHVLGIDPSTTLSDLQGRPMYLLDDRRRVEELV
ncbi:MAG: DUF1501 domain-containing protein [Planctomycetaceae bacterium]